MINWILQKNLTKPAILSRIKKSVIEDGEIYEEIEIVPFSNKLPELKQISERLVIYGSTTFMLSAFQDEVLQRGVYYDPTKFQMNYYIEKWGKNMLNHDGKLIKYKDLLSWSNIEMENWFVRPNHDKKEFGGRVDNIENLKKWTKQVIDLEIPELNSETEVWISRPKTILKEWRIFIVDDEIVTSSRYMLNGELSEKRDDQPKEMIDFVRSRIREYRLSDIYVMDIAEIDTGYRIIECNCFNGTGFYDHDIEKVVNSINMYLRKRNEA